MMSPQLLWRYIISTGWILFLLIRKGRLQTAPCVNSASVSLQELLSSKKRRGYTLERASHCSLLTSSYRRRKYHRQTFGYYISNNFVVWQLLDVNPEKHNLENQGRLQRHREFKGVRRSCINFFLWVFICISNEKPKKFRLHDPSSFPISYLWVIMRNFAHKTTKFPENSHGLACDESTAVLCIISFVGRGYNMQWGHPFPVFTIMYSTSTGW